MENIENERSPSSAAGRLGGKVALVIGGGTGIGAAAARMFARAGACVVIGDIREQAAGKVADDIIAGGGQAIGVHTNVLLEDSVKAVVDAAVARFGGLHALFNCAGGSLPEDAPVTEVDLSVWDQTMSLDVRGTILSCRHAIPTIIASGGGTVVNMSSGAALRGSGKAHIYAAAKGALVSLTRTLAGTYAKHNVRVNAICSGRVNTERIRRTYGVPGQPGQSADAMQVDEQIKVYPFWFGEPDDIAHIALFLSSDESRMITGAAIPADGGRSAY
ncbi:SDR family oxidoreductase [Paralcaligenes sp. KSB-10]|uniref:SDR family NAD(P)-dependent oxidoreductase n=1 Tax=Paralcaligenes sp. KSB-10 TaxID=2901142 RepID=UPI001E2E6983|nr:SDR family oxidoreductase [Paralcaligenes sp. KSB-10]UHL63081.1 SDR family oxidoreductase [Paralcaligenes sp. KSB-10]